MTEERKFAKGDTVRKAKGSSWQGRVVGFYSADLTPVGYAVESEREPGSVQIYPEVALEMVDAATPTPASLSGGWQDIGTAPKNTKVLAAYQNELGNWRIVTACYHTQLDWSDEYGDHEEEFAPEAWYEENDSSEVIYPTSQKPTHWMPLPAAPAVTDAGSDNA